MTKVALTIKHPSEAILPNGAKTSVVSASNTSVQETYTAITDTSTPWVLIYSSPKQLI